DLPLGPEDLVAPLPDVIRRDGAIEHRPLHDDCLRVVAVDHEVSARGRVQLGAMDRADDRLLAVDVLEDPRRDEAAALDRLPDLAMLLDQGDLVSGLRDLSREVPASRAGPDSAR